MEAAFNCLDIRQRGWIGVDECRLLLNELNEFQTLRDIEQEKMHMVFDALDHDHDNRIDIEEFQGLLDVLHLKFEHAEVKTELESYLPNVYYSECFQSLADFVRNRTFVFRGVELRTGFPGRRSGYVREGRL